MNEQAKTTTKPPNDWPHGYNYAAICPACKMRFFGPKRAPSCWTCASEETRQWWRAKFTSQKPEPGERKFWERMRKGGGRASLEPGHLLYERTGKDSRRITYLDRTNDVRPLMSGRLNVPDHLRAVGNLYGDSMLMARLGPAKPFAQEAVDGGGKQGDGVSARMIEAQEIANIARGVLRQMRPLRHRCNTKASRGAHCDIPVIVLVDAVCVTGQNITEVALRHGWWVHNGKMPKVQDKQSAKLRDALIEALAIIEQEWWDHGIDARRIVGVVEVR